MAGKDLVARHSGYKSFRTENMMSRIKVSRTAAAIIDRKKSREWPIVVYRWAFGLALVSYVVARIALDGFAHSYHWGSGIIGGVLGIGIG